LLDEGTERVAGLDLTLLAPKSVSTRLERVSLAAASFQHSEARPAEHTDGQVFADPNLHTHCVILNLGRRADGTVGALDGRFLFRWKMAAGAAYHTALAAELQVLGFSIGEIGKNGVFEISGIPTEAQEYFSEIEQATVDHV
jgi:conjugative relaxase-like TrwC/TraI family protein